MSDQYVPNTEEVREQYTREQPPKLWTVSENEAAFDRWLAQVKAEVWDEGYQACVDRLRPGVLMTPNPYRETSDDE